MRAKRKLTWLLLLFRLPATHKAERVAMWRKLKKCGAIQIQTSTYLLPDDPARYESFQWLAQQIRDLGGDATLARIQEIEGMSNERLIALFNRVRDEEYGAIKKLLHGFLARGKKIEPEIKAAELERLTRQFRAIREIDFFQSSRGQDIQMLLRRAEGTPKKDAAATRSEKLSRQDLADTASPRNRSGRISLVDSTIHRSTSEVRFCRNSSVESRDHSVRYVGCGILPSRRLLHIRDVDSAIRN